jgi:hypothetical protein
VSNIPRTATTAVVFLAASALMAGCSSSKPASSRTNSAPDDPATGVVVGVLRLVGGPAPGTSQAVAGRVYAYRDAALRGKPAAVSKADSDGGFKLILGPGTYYLAATSPQFRIDPEPATPPCHGERPAVVRAGDTTHVDVACPMK